MNALLAIDPGLNSLGWAFWGAPRVSHVRRTDQDRPPNRVGLIKASRKLELWERALWIAKEIEHQTLSLGEMGGAVGIRNIDFVSEYPEWMNIQLGWAAGDLQKLVFLVGVIGGYFHEAHSFTPVTPNQWKGQLPKEVVKRRLIKRFGPGATQEWERDVWDAVGIGMWKMGRF